MEPMVRRTEPSSVLHPHTKSFGVGVHIGVRAYAPRDRAAVRAIACETAVRGKPVESVWPDREVAADLLTRYYTDYEPGSLWVAEHAGQVIGYLTGCLGTQRYQRVMARRVVPHAVLGAITRGVLWSPQLWRLVRAGITTWHHGGFRQRAPLDLYPAHLHVNIQEGFRGQQVGRRLLERFLSQAAAAGVGGIHLAVREENVPARTLFEQMGFVLLSHRSFALPDGERLKISVTLTYGKRV